MATTKPKTPPKAPAKAKAADPAPAIPPTGGGTDPAPAGDPPAVSNVDISSDTAVQALASSNEPMASNEVNPQLAKAAKGGGVKSGIDHELAMDRLDKIETEAIRMGGDSGQIIRQLACEAMVALGKK